jgi:predicted RecB family nuclease
LVTSQLFEAYLACPTKCFLRSVGEPTAENAFIVWKNAKKESYCREGAQKLLADIPQGVGVGNLDNARLNKASWRFAFDQVIHVQNLRARVQIVERIPAKGSRRTLQLAPIRFIYTNKLSGADKLMAGFDALVLSRATGLPVAFSKIIYGDNCATFKVRTQMVSRQVGKIVSKIAALLSTSPPELALNRHCPECEFRDRCKKKAIEKDDLSLLTGLREMERVRLNRKGIFTVSQLSYTFRPRRRAKRLAS